MIVEVKVGKLKAPRVRLFKTTTALRRELQRRKIWSPGDIEDLLSDLKRHRGFMSAGSLWEVVKVER